MHKFKMSIVIAVSSEANKMCWRWKWVADNDVCTLKQTYKRTIITLYFIWINSSECITILSQWNQLNAFSHCNVSYDATWHRIVCDECVRKYRPRIKAVEKCSRQCLKKQFKSVAGNSIGFFLSACSVPFGILLLSHTCTSVRPFIDEWWKCNDIFIRTIQYTASTVEIDVPTIKYLAFYNDFAIYFIWL